tara:strand:- start:218 stop:427 length:210 start_codon:yes stop_codon:yes gene_type:complete
MRLLAMYLGFISPKVSEVTAEVLVNQSTTFGSTLRVISRQQVIHQSNKFTRRTAMLACITDNLSFGFLQ